MSVGSTEQRARRRPCGAALRPDPKDISRRYRTADELSVPAVVAGVASFAVMASAMNVAGYVAVGRGHHEGDVFTMISVHIPGMYGLVLIVGDVLGRFGRRAAASTPASRR